MTYSKLVLAIAILAPITPVAAQWQLGVSTGLNSFGGPQPLLKSSTADQLYSRTSITMNGTDVHISALKALSSRFDLGLEVGYASLTLGSTFLDPVNSEISPRFDVGSGAQLQTLVKGRFRISDDSWRLAIGVTGGAGFMTRSGFAVADPDENDQMTRPLGELGITIGYPLSTRFEVRVENSWLFYETVSNRTGLISSTKGMRDRRFSVGMEFRP